MLENETEENNNWGILKKSDADKFYKKEMAYYS